MQQRIEIKCPYCGNAINRYSEVGDSSPDFIYCEGEFGGCDRQFVVRATWSVSVAVEIGKLPWERDDDVPDHN